MSCKLYWVPVNTDKNYINNIQLREILNNKFGFKSKLNFSHIEYLNALVDAGVYDAQELVDAIIKFEVIEIGQDC